VIPSGNRLAPGVECITLLGSRLVLKL